MRGPGPSGWGSLKWVNKIWSEFCGTWSREWLLWQGPGASVLVNYRSILSSERVPHIKKPAIVDTGKKSGHDFQLADRHQDRLADWPSVVTSTSVKNCSCEKYEVGSWKRGQFSSPEEEKRSPLQAVTKQRQVKSECCSYRNFWGV
jgi:hypothetical protein